MSKTIIVDKENDSLYASVIENDEHKFYFDDYFTSYIFNISNLKCKSVKYSEDLDRLFVVDDKNNKYVFYKYSELKNEKVLKQLFEHIECENDSLIKVKQKNKLKIRKGLAAIQLSLVLAIESSAAPASFVNAAEEYPLNFSIEQLNKEEFMFYQLGSYVLQGITVVDNYRFVTAYDSLGVNKSKVFILNDNNVVVKEKLIDSFAHVGGITYDDKNDIIWITDTDGTISGYNKDDIISSKNDVVCPKFNREDVGSDLINIYGFSSVAYITYHDNKLYLGNYNDYNTTFMKCYELNDDGSINYDSVKVSKLTDSIQGITFYENEDGLYFLTSSSYGRYVDSKLKLYKYKDDETDYRYENSIEVELPPMVEQIDFDNNKLISVYESNALKYKTVFNPNPSDIIETPVDQIIASAKKNI